MPLDIKINSYPLMVYSIVIFLVISLCLHIPVAQYLGVLYIYIQSIYLTPIVVCKSVQTPHMKRNVDMICDLTRSRSPAHISLATIKGIDIVELILSNTC